MGDVTDEQPMEAGGGEEVMPDLAQLVELALQAQTAKVKQLETAKKKQRQSAASTASAAGSGGSGGGLGFPQVQKIVAKPKKYKGERDNTIPQPKKYKGERDNTILQQWLSSTRKYLDLLGRRVPEEQKVGVAASFLDESALQWWRQRQDHVLAGSRLRIQDVAHLADLLHAQFVVVPSKGPVKLDDRSTWPPEYAEWQAHLAATGRNSQGLRYVGVIRRQAPGFPPGPGLRKDQQAKPATRKPGAAAASVTGPA